MVCIVSVPQRATVMCTIIKDIQIFLLGILKLRVLKCMKCSISQVTRTRIQHSSEQRTIYSKAQLLVNLSPCGSERAYFSVCVNLLDESLMPKRQIILNVQRYVTSAHKGHSSVAAGKRSWMMLYTGLSVLSRAGQQVIILLKNYMQFT